MAGIQGRGLKRVLTAIVAVAVLGGVAAGPAGATSSARRVTGEGGPRVIGGQPVTPGQYPWLVAVVDHSEPRAYEGQFCGGTVVAPNWVLTAWHCVIDALFVGVSEDGSIDSEAYYVDPSAVDVVAGRSDLTSAGGERVAAAQIVPLPAAKVLGWIDGAYLSLFPVNDLALIRLKAPLSAPPIRLATRGDASLYTPPALATVVGWGTTVDPGGKTPPSYPTVAHAASIPMQSDSACAAAHGDAYVPSADVCAGAPGNITPGTGSCYGDSGGPLAAQDGAGTWVQTGIVSFGGETCASNGKPGVYARVSAFSDWVRMATGYGPFAGPGPFVAGQLQDFTNRPPSPASIQDWMALLGRTSPSYVIRRLASGTAWQKTAGMTDRLYRAAFGRPADTAGMTEWTDRLARGATATRLANALVASTEFRLRYGVLTDAAFVDHLYSTVLGRTPDPVNRATWLRRLRTGTSRGEVLATFAAQPVFTQRIAADTRIAQLWFGMLRSAPTAGQVATWRGRSDEAVRYLLTTRSYLGRTWPGINDQDFNPDFVDVFAAESVQRLSVDGDWAVDGLRVPR